jgi:hypothetical protein
MKMPVQFIRFDSLVVDDDGQLGVTLGQVNTGASHAFHSAGAWRNRNRSYFHN